MRAFFPERQIIMYNTQAIAASYQNEIARKSFLALRVLANDRIKSRDAHAVRFPKRRLRTFAIARLVESK
jgi:hypothetical protein